MERWLCHSCWEYSNGECNRGMLFNFPNFDFIAIFSSSFIISHFMIFEYFRLGLSANERAAHEILLELISRKLFDRMLVVWWIKIVIWVKKKKNFTFFYLNKPLDTCMTTSFERVY